MKLKNKSCKTKPIAPPQKRPFGNLNKNKNLKKLKSVFTIKLKGLDFSK
ncbi:hypothetical protein HMPREF1410_01032 [Helicobacter pylori GAM249T]|nr:hypothetical protein HMPREF1393_00779 [Helicobacter pylori GAM103Bi]EMH09118.1 hypothetical protein HMPREF1410_01032 [Helicobacter pylori GAM249T]